MDTTETFEPAVSQLREQLAQASQSQRDLLTEMANFAKDESLRFMNLRLERHGEVLDRLQTAQGVTGLIGVQQQWLRDLMSDYAAQQMRFASAFGGVAHSVAASATEAAGESVDRMQAQARDAVHQTAQAVADADIHVDNAMQEMGEPYTQETHH